MQSCNAGTTTAYRVIYREQTCSCYGFIASLAMQTKQESRAITGRTAWYLCKFRYVSNFTTATSASYVRFSCHSTAFLLVFVCRLQCINCQKVVSTGKNQSDRIFNADKYTPHDHSQFLSSSLFTANVLVVINRTRKERCEKARMLLQRLCYELFAVKTKIHYTSFPLTSP